MDRRVVVEDLMPMAARVVLGVAGLVPLLAPWELLLRAGWELPEALISPFFWLAVVVSAGAVAISVALVTGALVGKAHTITVDAGSGQVQLLERRGVLPRRRRSWPFAAVRGVGVRTTEWSDGPPTHAFALELDDGTRLRAGRWEDLDAATVVVERARKLVGSG